LADAVPEPTVPAAPAVAAIAVSISARTPVATHANPILILVDLILSLLRLS
jgi:hypothetical protein